MALETATYISDLVSTNPTASDNISQGDDHIRLLKATVKASFPNVTGAMTRTHTDLNNAVTLAGSETLTNKTLTAPTITGTTILGAGNATATPVDAILAGASGSGTNIAGADIIVRAGNGTGTGGSGYIAFETAAAGSTGSTANTLTERMRIDNAGNVGIGTNNPAAGLAKLMTYGASGEVRIRTESAGTTAADIGSYYAVAGTYFSYFQQQGNGSATLYGNATGLLLGTSAAGAVTLYTSGSERMRIDSSGNVGIGVTPAAATARTLQIAGGGVITCSNTNLGVATNATFDSTWKYIGTGAVTLYSPNAGEHVWFNATSGSAGGTVTLNERLRIGSSGQLGIGGANYGTSGQVLTSGGSGAAPSWATPSSGGMTLLGTISTASGTNPTLSGLTLTDYKQLLLNFGGVSLNDTRGVMIGTSTSDDVQVTATLGAASDGFSGFVWIDLDSGKFSSATAGASLTADRSASGAVYGGDLPITTASTTISVALAGSGSFDGGAIRVYGVK